MKSFRFHFVLKYLKTLGFNVTNDVFSKNSWYFRNSLVRANYTNIEKGIFETLEYLVKFLRNLLLHENNDLKNIELHINWKKVDIDVNKGDINKQFSSKTNSHINALYLEFGYDKIFGRSEVISIIDIKVSNASKLLRKMLNEELIETVKGQGKGKYKFRRLD